MSNERDPELTKLYREHSREEPSPALDAAILAAAHRAVASGPRKAGEATRPQRWWMPLAAAAAIGVVAIGVIQQMPKESAIDATSVAPATQAPPPVATQPAPQPPIEKPSAVAEQSPPVDALAKKQKEADAPSMPASPPPPPPPPAPAPAPAPAEKAAVGKLSATPPPPPASPRANEVTADRSPSPFPAEPAPRKTETASSEAKRDMPAPQPMADARKDAFREERQAAAPSSAGAAMAPPPAAAPASPAASAPLRDRMRSQEEKSVGDLAQSKNVEEEMRTLARDPDAWIARIRKLRDDGNIAQALRELKEFRTLVPDAERRLPADLRNLQP